jgi:hypothetical protein
MPGHYDALHALRLLYLDGGALILDNAGTAVARDAGPSPIVQQALRNIRQGVLDVLGEQGIRIDQPDCLYATPPDCIAPRSCTRLGWCTAALCQRGCGITRARDGP